MEIKPNRIIWHHSATISQGHQFKAINLNHRQRNFPISSLGFFVGYHYLIEVDGTIQKAREETEIGAHDQGENYGSIGICLAGNFNIEQPTKEQEEAAAEITDAILRRWNIPLTRIEPHRWGDQTDCPGKLLGDYWFVFNFLYKKVGWLQRLLWKLQGKIPS